MGSGGYGVPSIDPGAVHCSGRAAPTLHRFRVQYELIFPAHPEKRQQHDAGRGRPLWVARDAGAAPAAPPPGSARVGRSRCRGSTFTALRDQGIEMQHPDCISERPRRKSGKTGGIPGECPLPSPAVGSFVPLASSTSDACGATLIVLSCPAVERVMNSDHVRRVRVAWQGSPTRATRVMRSGGSPYLALMREDAPQRDHGQREVFDALRWLVRAGAPWAVPAGRLPAVGGGLPAGAAVAEDGRV